MDRSLGGSSGGPRRSGASWILHVLPFLDQANVYNAWDFETSVRGNAAIAQTDIPGLYCPTRRSGIQGQADRARLLDPSWTGGGTDYGGSTGRQHTFENDSDEHKHRFSSVVTDGEGEPGPPLQGQPAATFRQTRETGRLVAAGFYPAGQLTTRLPRRA